MLNFRLSVIQAGCGTHGSIPLLPAGGASAPGGSAPTRPAWLDAGREWAADNMYEYVDTCLSSAQVDDSLMVDAGAAQKRVWSGARQGYINHLVQDQGFTK